MHDYKVIIYEPYVRRLYVVFCLTPLIDHGSTARELKLLIHIINKIIIKTGSMDILENPRMEIIANNIIRCDKIKW